MMGLEPGALLAWVLIGLMAGSLATQFMPSGSYGSGRDIGIGLVGAMVGGLAVSWGLQGQGGLLGSVLAAFVGVVLITKLARSVPRRARA
jgi:uncharacterized membrane protein YeaQ/YmgE (transglycosylase-associated protein family)